MKFTLSWLKEHLDTKASLDEIVSKLTDLGLEVDHVEDPAEKFSAFFVAEVVSAEKHPDADRLKVCVVNTGDKKIQVVCGAPNARTGMKGIFAPVGSYIPGTDMTLKKGVIRGQESSGMLVSEREMGLSDDHEGIIDVTEENPDLGKSFASVFGMDDPVIDIDLTPDRADCAGVRGIARDLAAASLGKLKDLDEKEIKGSFKSNIDVHLKLDKDNADACPLFMGRTIKNVKNGPSPQWLQNKLKAIGLRPISTLVDITNYLSFDLCRPLHVFDAGKVTGDLHIRMAKKGEKLEALNDKTYELDEYMTAVCDDNGVLALGGIVGGTPSGCTEETTDVFLEVAYFDPARTAKTGRALQIISDARYRFERGVDPAFTVPALDLATKMIIDLCGGEASEAIMAGSVPSNNNQIEFTPDYVEKLAGLSVDEKRQKEILEALGFEVKTGKSWNVLPPSWRGDVEGKADLVEEIVRICGYDSIPPLSLEKDNPVTKSAETPLLTRVRKARTLLADRGLNECVTWSFMQADLAEKFGSNGDQNAKALTLVNPISSELNQMRPSILPNLVEAIKKNTDKGFPHTALFEIGPVFSSSKPDGQSWVATGTRSTSNEPRHWAGEETSREVDLYDAKADALAVLDASGAPTNSLQTTRDAPDWYHPGRSGALRLGPNILGYFGEIHPALLDEIELKGPVVGFEIFLNNIPFSKKAKSAARKPLKLSPLQPVMRDFAFIVDEEVESGKLIHAVKGADKNLIKDVEIFDVYQGKGVEDGKKSIALNVTLQPFEETLTEKELEEISNKIINNIIGKTGGELRG
jgi:phenylalanyl-tRNA synthetase beta chain